MSANFYDTKLSFLFGRCGTHYQTLGLLGTYNNNFRDDLTTPDCFTIQTNYPQTGMDSRELYFNFGEKCKKNVFYGFFKFLGVI